MKIIIGLIASSLVASIYAETTCDVVGSSSDPAMIKLKEVEKPPYNYPELTKAMEAVYLDAERCNQTNRVQILKVSLNNIKAISSIMATGSYSSSSSTSFSFGKIERKPAVEVRTDAKKVSIDCEDESTKPKTKFQIYGVDNNGEVEAEGSKGQMYIRLSYNHRKPELGRTIEVSVNGETNKLSLNPGLGPIGFKPGFAMRMLMKALGINSDIKLNCMPLTQKTIEEPKPEVIKHAEIVDDSSRLNEKEKEPVESQSQKESTSVAK